MWSQISILIQVLLVYLTCIHCQQFTFDNNALPVPPRFLVPGAFPPAINSGSPQVRTRVLQPAPREDETVQRLRLPTGRTRAGTLPPANLVPFELEHSPVSNKPPRIQSSQPVESLTIPTRPVVEEDEEDDTENSNTVASPVSTYEPNIINTVVARTQRPVAQFRPTKPQYFGNTNIIDEEERGDGNVNSEFHVTKAQKFDISQQATPVEGNVTPSSRKAIASEIPRKHFATRTQNSRPYSPQPQHQPQPQETVENKISKIYNKPVKSKYDKSSNAEKRSRKPVVAQVLRRYREDNPDGSITWGFENDDGSYKEETIGNDCITRGKYGYIDPDGIRREYSYSQGLPCDKNKKKHSEDDNNASGGYVDYSSNKFVLPNGDAVDLDTMVKNRARKPTKFKNS